MSKLLDMEFEAFYKRARKEQLEIVRKIMNKNEWITEFCNAMGASFFTEIINPNRLNEEEVFVEDTDKRIKEFTVFMDKWDNVLNLSGDPIMITKGAFDDLIETTDW